MTVLSKLLYGCMHVRAFDWAVPGDSSPADPPQPRLAELVEDQVIASPCPPDILFPTSGGNIHAFTALSACAVLDVLAPPYSAESGRHCTYFQELPPTRFPALQSAEGLQEGREYGWLEAYEPSHSFVVQRGHYRGPIVLEQNPVTRRQQMQQQQHQQQGGMRESQQQQQQQQRRPPSQPRALARSRSSSDCSGEQLPPQASAGSASSPSSSPWLSPSPTSTASSPAAAGAQAAAAAASAAAAAAAAASTALSGGAGGGGSNTMKRCVAQEVAAGGEHQGGMHRHARQRAASTAFRP
eukprot:TRINITY_DN29863_c0_g2_i1.p1 TRINITY_DN29863_c0_g2~~TRINITY_DN29863_c0_g2_i1.p1  ORF type:complete len:307 (-),score=-18.71 TRINITY_DN29863_c0_g2_i1:342-1232(-)